MEEEKIVYALEDPIKGRVTAIAGGEGPGVSLEVHNWAEDCATFDLTQEQALTLSYSVLRHYGFACTIPPAGWYCTRHPGHDGPCAAHPAAGECHE